MTNLHRLLCVTVSAFVLAVLCSGCAGTIDTVKYAPQENIEHKKVYIVSAQNSQYIQFRLGIILPIGYIVLPDDPSKEHEVIGNTDLVIKSELEKYGIKAEIVQQGDVLGEFDLIVEYHDIWRWDFKKILDKLEIVFIAPSGAVISKSVFNIYQNKEMHNFPTPEKEVPQMIKELLGR